MLRVYRPDGRPWLKGRRFMVSNMGARSLSKSLGCRSARLWDSRLHPPKQSGARWSTCAGSANRGGSSRGVPSRGLKREEALVKGELVLEVLLLTLAKGGDLLAKRDEAVVVGLGAYRNHR